MCWARIDAPQGAMGECPLAVSPGARAGSNRDPAWLAYLPGLPGKNDRASRRMPHLRGTNNRKAEQTDVKPTLGKVGIAFALANCMRNIFSWIRRQFTRETPIL